jgi:L-rhamnose mutarotase
MTIFRRAWTMQLREGAEEAYDSAHAAIWPELAQQMVADGISRFYLFRSGLTVFALQERLHPFPDADDTPSQVTMKWWKAMARLMLTDATGRPSRTALKEVFVLEPEPEQKELTE